MPRKSFEEQPYDPIRADLVREVTANGRGQTLPKPIALAEALAMPLPLPPPNQTPQVNPAEGPALNAGLRGGTTMKRFLLTRAEDGDLNLLLSRLQQRSGVKITFSVLVRALIATAMQAEAAILGEVGQYQFRQPSTLDSLALSEFEDQWQQCLTEALRQRPSEPIRTV